MSYALCTANADSHYEYSQVTYLRKTHGSRLNVFAPVQDLSALSLSGLRGLSPAAGVKNDMAVAGGQVLGDEYTDHVVKVRSNMRVVRTFSSYDPDAKWCHPERKVSAIQTLLDLDE